jgi:hypothetical protein
LTAKKKTTRRGNFLESNPVNTQQAGRQIVAFVSLVQYLIIKDAFNKKYWITVQTK